MRSQGAVQVHAACSHGLFTGGAIARLLRYVDGVHATGSLPNARDVISGGPALARGVEQVLGELGLSSNENGRLRGIISRFVLNLRSVWLPLCLYSRGRAEGCPYHEEGEIPMSVHVQFETPEDLANKIYDMIDLNKNGRVKKGSNEVTKAAERGTAQFIILAEDVNPPELLAHIPFICREGHPLRLRAQPAIPCQGHRHAQGHLCSLRRCDGHHQRRPREIPRSR